MAIVTIVFEDTEEYVRVRTGTDQPTGEGVDPTPAQILAGKVIIAIQENPALCGASAQAEGVTTH